MAEHKKLREMALARKKVILWPAPIREVWKGVLEGWKWSRIAEPWIMEGGGGPEKTISLKQVGGAGYCIDLGLDHVHSYMTHPDTRIDGILKLRTQYVFEVWSYNGHATLRLEPLPPLPAI